VYDAQMNTEVISADAYPTWDFVVQNGSVPIITGTTEEEQRACISAFLQKGTIPNLESVGVDWTGFFMKELDFGGLDESIRRALANADLTEYAPVYDLVDDTLYTLIRKESA
jgi:hypothetical protein